MSALDEFFRATYVNEIRQTVTPKHYENEYNLTLGKRVRKKMMFLTILFECCNDREVEKGGTIISQLF